MSKKKDGPGSGDASRLMPPVRDKSDPRYIKMRAGLDAYNEKRRLDKLTAQQAKANLEGIFQQLSLEDLAGAVSEGAIKAETINIALKAAKTIEQIEEIPVAKRTKDHNEMWKFCMNQLRMVTGQEAAKKAEQTVDLRDNDSLSKEDLEKKLAAHKAKYNVDHTFKPKLVKGD